MAEYFQTPRMQVGMVLREPGDHKEFLTIMQANHEPYVPVG